MSDPFVKLHADEFNKQLKENGEFSPVMEAVYQCFKARLIQELNLAVQPPKKEQP
jgi:hypothetical protein